MPKWGDCSWQLFLLTDIFIFCTVFLPACKSERWKWKHSRTGGRTKKSQVKWFSYDQPKDDPVHGWGEANVVGDISGQKTHS